MTKSGREVKYIRRLQNSLSRNSGCTICTKKGRLATASGARFCMDWTDASVPERVSQLPIHGMRALQQRQALPVGFAALLFASTPPFG